MINLSIYLSSSFFLPLHTLLNFSFTLTYTIDHQAHTLTDTHIYKLLAFEEIATEIIPARSRNHDEMPIRMGGVCRKARDTGRHFLSFDRLQAR